MSTIHGRWVTDSLFGLAGGAVSGGSPSGSGLLVSRQTSRTVRKATTSMAAIHASTTQNRILSSMRVVPRRFQSRLGVLSPYRVFAWAWANARASASAASGAGGSGRLNIRCTIFATASFWAPP